MQTYDADIECREPAAPGFSCGTDDTVSFSHIGVLTRKSAQDIINDDEFVNKRCWKCFAQNWRVKSFKPVAYQASYGAIRGA